MCWVLWWTCKECNEMYLEFWMYWQVVLALIFLFGVASLLSCKDRMSTYLLYSDMAAKFDAGLATHVQCFCRKDCCGPCLSWNILIVKGLQMLQIHWVSVRDVRRHGILRAFGLCLVGRVHGNAESFRHGIPLPRVVLQHLWQHSKSQIDANLEHRRSLQDAGDETRFAVNVCQLLRHDLISWRSQWHGWCDTVTFVVFALLFVAFLHGGGQDCSTVSLGISLLWCNGQYGSEARAPCAETHYVVDQELRHFFGQEILQTDACLAKIQHPVHLHVAQ